MEVRSSTPWNVALVESDVANPGKSFAIEQSKPGSDYFWNIENAPLRISIKGYFHEGWEINKQQAGPIPWSPQNPWNAKNSSKPRETEIELIPYGCTTLRISAFPTINRPKNK